MTATYEVNADGNRTYSSTSAKNVADVAVEWSKQGHAPKAFAVRADQKIRCVDVPVTTKAATARNLAAAK